MKKKILFTYIFLLCLLIMGCVVSIIPQLVSIDFIDDKTIEYEFSYSSKEGFNSYFIHRFGITPDDNYKMVKNTASGLKGEIVFNKDIPDGAKIELDFYNSDGVFILNYSFVKGETSEEKE